jgi:hypothetical protein
LPFCPDRRSEDAAPANHTGTDAAGEATGQYGFTDVLWSETRTAVTNVLAGYYNDLHTILMDPKLQVQPGSAYLDQIAGDPHNGQYGMRRAYGEASVLLSSVLRNDGDAQRLYEAAAAQATYNPHGAIDAAHANNLKYGAINNNDQIAGAYSNYGAELRRMLSAAHMIDAKNAADTKNTEYMLRAFGDVVEFAYPEMGLTKPVEMLLRINHKLAINAPQRSDNPLQAENNEYQARLQTAGSTADTVLVESMQNGLWNDDQPQSQLDRQRRQGAPVLRPDGSTRRRPPTRMPTSPSSTGTTKVPPRSRTTTARCSTTDSTAHRRTRPATELSRWAPRPAACPAAHPVSWAGARPRWHRRLASAGAPAADRRPPNDAVRRR